MAGAYQGFEIKRNLEENPVDINALNNLGEAPIADDISLFKNNVRNVSTVTVANSNINFTTDVITFTNTTVTFTSGTRVLFNNSVYYYIKNSDGESQFQLSSSPNLSDTVQLSNSFSGTYVRSDEVTLENITNYRKRRRDVSVISSDEVAISEVGNFEPNIKQNIIEAEANIVKYKTKKESTILKNKNFISDVNFNNEGHILISDPDGFNNSGLSVYDGPGIFVYNFTSNTKIRAFSDSQNVWEPNGTNTYLQTTSKKITVGSLTVIANNLSIEEKAGTSPPLVNSSVTAANITTAVFNNKIKVLINDEEYYLCLSNSAAVP